MNTFENKVCYIIAFYFGERRSRYHTQQNDKLFLLKKHIELLSDLNHSITKIIFNFNTEKDHYSIINDAIKIIPKKIQNSEVEIVIRENIGMSYGAWSDSYLKNKDQYDYFIFNEDDYFFVIDEFDKILITKFSEKINPGYLCGLVVSDSLNTHAGISTGISSNKVLSQVVEKYGELPHVKSNNYKLVEVGSQIEQTNCIVRLGYNLYDLGDEYIIYFQGNEIQVYYQSNTKEILLPASKVLL